MSGFAETAINLRQPNHLLTEDTEVSFPDLSLFTDADTAAETNGECEHSGSEKDFYFDSLNGMLPPRKRIDFALFVVICACALYLVRSSDADVLLLWYEVGPEAPNFTESPEAKAVRRLQAMYFDMVCRMRPRRPSSPWRQVKQLSDFVEASAEQLMEPADVQTNSPTRLLLLHASPLCILTRANGEPTWAPLPRLRIHREISAVEKALFGALPVEVDVATIHNLRKAVTEAKNLWLHLSAHTVNGNALILEDGCGGTEAHWFLLLSFFPFGHWDSITYGGLIRAQIHLPNGLWVRTVCPGKFP